MRSGEAPASPKVRLPSRAASALARVRDRRAQARVRRERTHLYVVPGHEDNPYELYAVTARSILVRGTRSGGVLALSADGPGRWLQQPP